MTLVIFKYDFYLKAHFSLLLKMSTMSSRSWSESSFFWWVILISASSCCCERRFLFLVTTFDIREKLLSTGAVEGGIIKQSWTRRLVQGKHSPRTGSLWNSAWISSTVVLPLRLKNILVYANPIDWLMILLPRHVVEKLIILLYVLLPNSVK